MFKKDVARKRTGMAVLLLALSCASAVKAADIVEWDGVIEPRQTVNVGTPVPGILETITVDRGDYVKKGQLIARLQSSVEKAAVELARVRAQMYASIKSKREELEFALRNQSRLKELYDKKAIPHNEWDQAETKRILAELQLAEAIESKEVADMELKRATKVLTRMSITSPLSGVVVERYLNPGEYIEDQAIMKIAQVDPLYVEIFLPVHVLGSIKVGMTGMVKPQEPCSGEHPAKVIVVDEVVDAASGIFGVRLELPNPDRKVTAGLKCKVFFQMKTQ